MTIPEFLSQVESEKINPKMVKPIETTYGCKVPADVARLLSVTGEKAIFLDGGTRILSHSEITHAKHQLKVNFKEKKLIPVADCGDNDFIVYDIDAGKWTKFNIVDETPFQSGISLKSVLK